MAGVAFVVAGCGTRVHTAAPALPGVTAQPVVSDEMAANPAAEAAAGAGQETSAIAAPGSATAPAGRAVTTPTTARAIASSGGGATTPSAAGSKPGNPPPGGERAGSVPVVTASSAPTGAAPKAGSDLVVGSVGTYSGPAGGTLVPILQGAQLWTKAVNEKGGVNGHRIKLVIYDDGGDPARHRAQVQQAVERDRVLAFLSNGEVLTGQGSVEYITSKRIPVIGSELASPWFYKSPMYFPQASSGDSVMIAALGNAAQELIPKGKKKLATLVCQEAQACSDGQRIFTEEAVKAGFEYVYKGKGSIAQPDFTAECLSARNAGADAMILIMDVNSISRISSSCGRQSYRPAYALVSSQAHETQRNDPNLDGTTAASTVFPYFQADTAATQEFQKARQLYGQGITIGVSLATGWVSGKLLERAAASLPDPPTSDAILRGLWSIKNDSLGGLTLPLTFNENQSAEPKACWFTIALQNKVWTNLDGNKLHCR